MLKEWTDAKIKFKQKSSKLDIGPSQIWPNYTIDLHFGQCLKLHILGNITIIQNTYQSEFNILPLMYSNR